MYSWAALASEPGHPQLFVSESRNIRPLPPIASLSTVSQSAGRTSCLATTETRRLSFLPRQTSCARPPSRQSCPSLEATPSDRCHHNQPDGGIPILQPRPEEVCA